MDFETYIKEVLEWFDLQKPEKQQLYVDFFIAMKNVEVISWDEINKNMNGVFNTFDKKCFSKKFNDKLGYLGEKLSILSVAKMIVSYADVIGKKLDNPKNNESQSDETQVDKPLDEQIEIPCLNEIFNKIDKMKPFKERIRQVLVEMGLDEQDYTVGLRLIEVSYAAVIVNTQELTWDNVLEKANIELEDHSKVRAELSNFIRTFMKNNGYNENALRAMDFLKILKQKI